MLGGTAGQNILDGGIVPFQCCDDDPLLLLGNLRVDGLVHERCDDELALLALTGRQQEPWRFGEEVDSQYDQDCKDDLEAYRKPPGKRAVDERETKVLNTRR